MWNDGFTTARMLCVSGATSWRAPPKPSRGVPLGKMVSLLQSLSLYMSVWASDAALMHGSCKQLARALPIVDPLTVCLHRQQARHAVDQP